MTGDQITKRLHISGLTPAITSDDLSRRLASFGSVSALDGLGKLDALGQPRNFAYITLETTKTQLSRCMNLLSGSTWKGAKLRIGEAKPDFRERILHENASMQAEETRPRTRRRLVRGVHCRHAQDMSLVTLENVPQRPQWRVTPLGRLIRPMRMRPARPLGPPLDVIKSQDISKGQGKVRRKRASAMPPARARVRTIDPLRWGSMHLSGIFLGGEQTAFSPALVPSGEASGEGNGETTEVEEVEEILDATQSPADDNLDVALRAEPSAPRDVSPRVPFDPASTDLEAEKARALHLLSSIFGEANEDWGGAESVDSEMEQVAAAPYTNAVPSTSPRLRDATDFEVVPSARKKESSPAGHPTQSTTTSRNTDRVPSATKLKDLFAPREEEGFSLIGHLSLDMDLDLDLDRPAFANSAPARTSLGSAVVTHPYTTPTPIPISKSMEATLPFFFPQKSNSKGHEPKVKFARTEEEAQIRSRWEASRGELTHDWKRRHREAVKSRRRRGGPQLLS
ncbi:hypothetical protein F5148DRAFT_1003802 [Russula earlei]|uniref:Uncharacterized protein n=1 Tax=Russula earlei TaxID=71964 RepID=A0ACC0TWR2_9AGAM|nr:hypothetical protein F5148DRAFT_1003802 [Russula earlei]